MIVFIKLLLAHLMGDFYLQPPSWIKDKETKKIQSTKLYLHCLVHGGLTFLFLWDAKLWLLPVVLILVHGLIDLLKVYSQQEKTRIQWFVIDQVLHLISLWVLWKLWFQPTIDVGSWFSNAQFWLYATALVFLTTVCGIIIQILMMKWSIAVSDADDDSLAQAGKFIGILERLFVFAFIITAHWEAVGFLLAAKSVFRFGDLKESKDRKLTEYILIGTLLSFGLAIATGMVVVWLGASMG